MITPGKQGVWFPRNRASLHHDIDTAGLSVTVYLGREPPGKGSLLTAYTAPTVSTESASPFLSLAIPSPPFPAAGSPFPSSAI